MDTKELQQLSLVPTTQNVVSDIKAIISQARKVTVQAVNSAMVVAYWLIGKRIVEEQQQGKDTAKYGEQVLKKLSKNLVSDFGNGFSYANLRNMRQFYRTYPDIEICYTLCSKLTWSHNRLIMRVADNNARIWYIKETVKEQWSVRQLERNIRSFYYQRHLQNDDNNSTDDTNAESSLDVKSFVKDPYVLEFVGLPAYPQYKEKDLENALIDNMQQFLLELGKGFSFIKRQYRISTETSHFYIDLVFYNYILKCFVLIDLKTTKLTHRDIGQMDMYIRMFDDIKRGKDDNPTVGILMYAERDETIVKYSVLEDSKQIFATKYLPYLPTEQELKDELERRQISLK